MHRISRVINQPPSKYRRLLSFVLSPDGRNLKRARRGTIVSGGRSLASVSSFRATQCSHPQTNAIATTLCSHCRALNCPLSYLPCSSSPRSSPCPGILQPRRPKVHSGPNAVTLEQWRSLDFLSIGMFTANQQSSPLQFALGAAIPWVSKKQRHCDMPDCQCYSLGL